MHTRCVYIMEIYIMDMDEWNINIKDAETMQSVVNRKIVSWKIVATNESGDDIDITDLPDDVAQVVDEFITDDIQENN